MTREKTAERIETILVGLAERIERTGTARWRLGGSREEGAAASAELRGSWVLLETAARTPDDTSRGSLLLANRLLAGAAKAVLSDAGKAILRAEIPAEIGVDCERWITDTWFGFQSFPDILDRVRGKEPSAGRPARAGGEPGTANDPEEKALAESIEEAGWAFERRSDGALSVDLETSRGPRRAFARRIEDGSVRVTARIGRFGPGEEHVLETAGLFLLRAFSGIRLARPAAEKEDDGGYVLDFEVALLGSPSGRAIDHALQALSAALFACGRETPRFRTERIASAYARSLGWTFRPVPAALEQRQT
jgi:hypothetical protein